MCPLSLIIARYNGFFNIVLRNITGCVSCIVVKQSSSLTTSDYTRPIFCRFLTITVNESLDLFINKSTCWMYWQVSGEKGTNEPSILNFGSTRDTELTFFIRRYLYSILCTFWTRDLDRFTRNMLLFVLNMKAPIFPRNCGITYPKSSSARPPCNAAYDVTHRTFYSQDVARCIR